MKKSTKLYALLLAAILLLLTAVPAFAAGSRTKIAKAPALAPYQAMEIPTDVSPDVDWDAVMDGIWDFLFVSGTGNSYDLSQYHIPYTESNMNYIFSVCNNTPRYLHIVPSLSYYEGGILSAIFNNIDLEVVRAKYDACLNAMEQILYGIKGNSSLSNVDKCLLVHDRLAAWVAYDTVNYHAGTLPKDAYSPYGPLALHSGVCNGYALAYNWMLEELGIPADYTSSDEINHGWSKVKLNGQYYYVDVTWDDPTEDIPGRVTHTQFLLSGATCSARHRNVTDFDMTPNNTQYESYITDNFGNNVKSEIVLVGNKYYYVTQEGNSCYLTSRNVSGGISSAKKLVTIDHWVTSADPNYLTEYNPVLVAIGNTILYTNSRAVYAYDTTNTSTGYAPTVCYTPSSALFPEDHYFLRGIEQVDGTVYVTSGPVQFNQSTVSNYTDSFVYCNHTSEKVVLSSTTGPDCQTHGDAKLICPDCRKLFDGIGQGPTAEHSWTWIIDTAATCGKAGVKHEECSVCHTKRNMNTTIAATGAHSWGWITDTAATCNAAGVKHEECTVCHTKRNMNTTIAATGAHSWSWITDTAPTCGKTGVKHEECSACHAKRNEGTVISATGAHHWNSGVVTKVATCNVPGVKTFTCTNCGATKTESISIDTSAHQLTFVAAKAATTEAEGNVEYYHCAVCGKNFSDASATNQLTKVSIDRLPKPGEPTTENQGNSTTDNTPDGGCPYCGETHGGLFGWLIGLIHRLLAMFGMHK